MLAVVIANFLQILEGDHIIVNILKYSEIYNGRNLSILHYTETALQRCS